MSAGQMVLFAIGCVAVIAAAYYTTYFVAKKSTGRSKKRQGGDIRPVGQISLGKDKGIHLVEVGEKIYLIAVTGQNVTLLDTLEPGDLDTTAPAAGQASEGGQVINMSQWLKTFTDLVREKVPGDHAPGRPPKSGGGRKGAGKTEDAPGERDNLDEILERMEVLRARDQLAKSSVGEDGRR